MRKSYITYRVVSHELGNVVSVHTTAAKALKAAEAFNKKNSGTDDYADVMVVRMVASPIS